MAMHLNLAAFKMVIVGAFWPGHHKTLDLNTELVSQVFCDGEHLLSRGIADHLHIALTVSQVDKDHASMIASTIDPSTKGHGLTNQGFSHDSAVMSTHRHVQSSFYFNLL